MSYYEIPKDPVILLSWINTKLRDECHSLECLSEKYAINIQALNNKLNAINYYYDLKTNQFK